MSTWDDRYLDRLRMLVQMLPQLDKERRFALKGGTAINLFEHDLPRLSVDIDLAWLPVQDFATDAAAIGESLATLAERLRAPPLKLQVQASATADAGAAHRLIASRGRTRVQIETTPVMRGTVHPVRRMHVRAAVERDFGSAEVQVLHFADLYAGKMAAALSRQHPRDLFDIAVLLDGAGVDGELWRTFLVYLTASPNPAAIMLEPSEPHDFKDVFENHFRGMTREPVTAERLLEARSRLLARIPELLDASTQAFLISVEKESPDFNLIGFPEAANLPGVLRKMHNLAGRDAKKREADYRRLHETLERIARGRAR